MRKSATKVRVATRKKTAPKPRDKKSKNFKRVSIVPKKRLKRVISKRVSKKKLSVIARRREIYPSVKKRIAKKKVAIKKIPARKPAKKIKKKVEWLNLSTPRPTGFSKDYGKKKKRKVKDEVIFLSPKTQKPVSRATRGMKILYAHRDIEGKVTVLHPFPQKPEERLRAWLESRIQKQPGHAILFTQQALRVVIPPKGYKPKKMEKVVRGVLRRRSPRSKKWETVHETKLAVPSLKSKQQAVRYTRGKVKAIEPGRVVHKREEIRAYARPKFIQPGFVKNISITGNTIWDSLSPLVLNKQLKRLKPWEQLFYEYVVIYRDPITGEKHTIPGRGRQAENEATTGPAMGRLAAFGAGVKVASKKLEKAAWPIVSQIARSIRLSLAENGVRFSSKFTLGKIQDKLESKLDESEDPRESAALERALNETEAYNSTYVGGRRQGGTNYESLEPLNPERQDGKQYRKTPDALRVMLRLTTVPDNQEKLKWEAKKVKKAKPKFPSKTARRKR